jgi:hypothetical protein
VAYRSIESLCTLLQGKKQSQRYNEHGNHRYRKFMQNTRSMQKVNRGTQVENSSIAWRSTIKQARPLETTVEHQQAEGAHLARAKPSRRNTNTQGRIVYNPKE